MDFLKKVVTYSRFRVIGKFEFSNEKVQTAFDQNQFLDLKECGEEVDESFGWVSPENCLEPPYIGHIVHEPYFCLTMRHDCRIFSKTLLHAKMSRKEKKKMQESGRERLTRQEKDELRKEVRSELLAQTPIKTSVFRALWNSHTQNCLLLTSSRGVQKIFSKLFEKTFGLVIELRDPTSIAKDWAQSHNAMAALSNATPSSFQLESQDLEDQEEKE